MIKGICPFDFDKRWSDRVFQKFKVPIFIFFWIAIIIVLINMGIGEKQENIAMRTKV